MSRSEYSDDCDGWDLIRWRGAVNSALRGRRGQQLLRDMADALDALPTRELIAGELINKEGKCCALGAVALYRGLGVDKTDPEDREAVALLLNIAPALAAEIAFENDEAAFWYDGSSEVAARRWHRMRQWVTDHLHTALGEDK